MHIVSCIGITLYTPVYRSDVAIFFKLFQQPRIRVLSVCHKAYCHEVLLLNICCVAYEYLEHG